MLFNIPLHDVIKLFVHKLSFGCILSATLRRAAGAMLRKKGVRFANKTRVATFQEDEHAIVIPYD